MWIFKVIFILEVLKITSLPFSLCLWLFSLICDDRVFTQKKMMLQVIELLSEKLNDESDYLFFLIFVLILCKYLKSYEEGYVFKHYIL